ncbi:MAG: hypothetical protein BWZ08_01307 [candidate division BRC1 bacterium ADurb.BinA292]|nr:MAG: hypothetical protein BWZ08_01307 [candidate division BRC1 bacterium ADurb.BinA292]
MGGQFRRAAPQRKDARAGLRERLDQFGETRLAAAQIHLLILVDPDKAFLVDQDQIDADLARDETPDHLARRFERHHAGRDDQHRARTGREFQSPRDDVPPEIGLAAGLDDGEAIEQQVQVRQPRPRRKEDGLALSIGERDAVARLMGAGQDRRGGGDGQFGGGLAPQSIARAAAEIDVDGQLGLHRAVELHHVQGAAAGRGAPVDSRRRIARPILAHGQDLVALAQPRGDIERRPRCRFRAGDRVLPERLRPRVDRQPCQRLDLPLFMEDAERIGRADVDRTDQIESAVALGDDGIMNQDLPSLVQAGDQVALGDLERRAELILDLEHLDRPAPAAHDAQCDGQRIVLEDARAVMPLDAEILELTAVSQPEPAAGREQEPRQRRLSRRDRQEQEPGEEETDARQQDVARGEYAADAGVGSEHEGLNSTGTDARGNGRTGRSFPISVVAPQPV